MAHAPGPDEHARPWLDADTPLPERAAALLARLTTTERLALLHQHAPAVERLGLRAFRTGTEALHGVAWLGTATVFPQPVGLAATWDADLVERVGAAVGTEVRARHAADPSISLNVWAPVVDPLRHPAWGRNEEGWSSDPHVTAWLATAYARGLRGDDPVHWRTVPTLKHALGYDNETDRAVTSTQLRPRVLHEYELPAFAGPLAAGVVGAVMPSYNLVNGRPAHLSGELLDELRSWADGSLLVVSDAAAPGNVVTSQRYHDDHVTAHAALLRAGVDSFTDNDADAGPTTARLAAARAQGLLTQDDVDRAALRHLELRLRTGELDPDRDPWRVGPQALDLPEHRALAREAAARGVVVLENDGVLPIAPDTSVAVVGPHAERVLHDWYSGTPPYVVDLAAALRERLGPERVHVADGADRIALTSHATGRCVRALPDGTLVADADAAGTGDVAHDVTDWGDGLVTIRDVTRDLLWSGAAEVLRADAARVGGWVAQEPFLRHRHDDGTWSLRHAGSGRWVRVQHDEQGTLVADARDAADAERFHVQVLRDGGQEVARVAAAADVVVVTAGNDPHLHGRETQDRPHLDLPAPQAARWRAVAAHHPRAVLLVVSSYPYVLGDLVGGDGMGGDGVAGGGVTGDPGAEADGVRRPAVAVVWSAHAGQELGHGLTDVLLGDAEPTGRLAQEWPVDAAQAGDLLDYDIVATRTTHWYSRRPPRYGLGHGLTYGDVTYTDLRVDGGADGTGRVRVVGGTRRERPPGEVLARVTLTNRGARPAHELVQVYVDAPGHRLPFPHRLVAHRRVTVPAGGQVEVELPVPLGQLAVWDVTRDRWVVEPGRYVLGAGPSSALVSRCADLLVDGEPVPPRDLRTAPVRAADADDLVRVDLAEATRPTGTCVQVRRGHPDGHVVLRDCLTAGATTVELTLARTRAGAAAVEVLDPDGAVLARAEVPAAAGRHDWRTVRVPWTAAPASADVLDLRLRLVGAARLDTLRLV